MLTFQFSFLAGVIVLALLFAWARRKIRARILAMQGHPVQEKTPEDLKEP